MLRKVIFLIGLTTAVCLADAEPAQAGRWSPGNPGIYGNIHGVTYRSMRYEQQRGTRGAIFSRSRSSGWFRRR